jgi:hypothetical protein
MNVIELTQPGFAAGQRLSAEALNALQQYQEHLATLNLARMSDGILYGLQVLADPLSASLQLTPGAFKWQTRYGWLDHPMTLDAPPANHGEPYRLQLSLAHSTPIEEPNYGQLDQPMVVTGIRYGFALNWATADALNTLELARVRYTQGVSFKNHRIEVNPDELPRWLENEVPAGVIDRRQVPWASLGEYPGLQPDYQRKLAGWIMESGLQAACFMVPDLLKGQFPVCDFTRTTSLSEALGKLLAFLKATRIQPATPQQPSYPTPTAPGPKRPVLGG